MNRSRLQSLEKRHKKREAKASLVFKNLVTVVLVSIVAVIVTRVVSPVIVIAILVTNIDVIVVAVTSAAIAAIRYCRTTVSNCNSESNNQNTYC